MKKKATILIIEDEADAAFILKEKLADENYDVLIAKNGKEGVVLAEKKIPDLILLDIVMPVMDGITALSKIKANKKTSSIPVIMLTNLSDSEKKEIAASKGVRDFLIKTDWTIADVMKKVKNKLND